MASQALELTLISAQDLKNVNLLSRMEVYAAVSIDGDKRTEHRTPADRAGGTNPAWNTTVHLTIPPGDPCHHHLRMLLRTERALWDRDVGEVRVPLAELISGKGPGPHFVRYQVRSISSGNARGLLNISYKFSDTMNSAAYPPMAGMLTDDPPTAYAAYSPPASMVDSHAMTTSAYPPPATDKPVTAYPAPGSYTYPPPYSQPATAAPYPAPQEYSGYPPPMHAGYGYPPAQQVYGGYGYGGDPVAPQQPPRKNNFGLGLGTGLLGGALGGMLIGDMLSDDQAAYDAGYNDGSSGFYF